MNYLILPLLFAAAYGAQIAMNQAGGAYNFHYGTGDAGGHQRSESGHGGAVSGSYSYVDPNGHLRQVSYTAGPDGFKATGDTGVDKNTAAAAAAIAQLAPKAPVAVAPVAPVAHWGYAPYYGHAAVYGVPGNWGAHW